MDNSHLSMVHTAYSVGQYCPHCQAAVEDSTGETVCSLCKAPLLSMTLKMQINIIDQNIRKLEQLQQQISLLLYILILKR